MMNLCLNARDAMAAGGVIRISAVNSTNGEDSISREFVKIRVSDTGPGMAPDVVARAFEPFFTTKDVSKGSGLGLPQVYGFAQQSEGRVTIESTLGTGTTVTLLLPRSLRRPAAARPDDQPAGSSIPERRGSALLVEDDREVSALAGEMLGSLGFAVTHVASAEAALGALANSRTIDVVLSDVMMPGGVTGLQLAREIRRRYPELPIVLTTGCAESVGEMTDGEFELLLKPYSLEALADALGVSVK